MELPQPAESRSLISKEAIIHPSRDYEAAVVHYRPGKCFFVLIVPLGHILHPFYADLLPNVDPIVIIDFLDVVWGGVERKAVQFLIVGRSLWMKIGWRIVGRLGRGQGHRLII